MVMFSVKQRFIKKNINGHRAIGYAKCNLMYCLLSTNVQYQLKALKMCLCASLLQQKYWDVFK